MIQIAPSLLSADFANLQADIKKIENHADWLHLDIMDGSFVPNISYGIPVVAAVNKVTSLPLDVHLMISNPDKYLEQFAKAGADLITVHVETCPHLHRTISFIKQLGCKAGVALNPHTMPECLKYVISDLDLILIMSVNPGFGGQSFIDAVLPKATIIKQMVIDSTTANSPIIAIDGGINLHNIERVAKFGVEFFVAGSAVFKAPNPQEAILELKKAATIQKI